MFEVGAYVIGLGVLYYSIDKNSKKPVDDHTELANRIFEKEADGAMPSYKVLLQMHQNLNAARAQRALRNIEFMILIIIVGLLFHAFGEAYWQR